MQTQIRPIAEGLTYTMAKGQSRFNATSFELKVTMPTFDYDISGVYDISKFVGGKIKNCIIVFIKGRINNTKLPRMSSGILSLSILNSRIDHTISNDLQTDSPVNDECIVIIFHDYPVTPADMKAQAEKQYEDFETYKVSEDYPFSNNYDEDDKKKDEPKKMGMSLIKKG